MGGNDTYLNELVKYSMLKQNAKNYRKINANTKNRKT